MRFEDTPNLFGCGAGTSTSGGFECDMCGVFYDEGGWIRWTTFARIQICENCFEEIEKEVLHRMSDILPWYKRILERKRKQLKEAQSQVNEIDKLNKNGKTIC